MTRPDWDSYFLNIAKAVSERSDCERSKVGAVVVKNRRIHGTGYNGSPAGKPGCQDCPRRLADVVAGETPYDHGVGRCVAVHAEANALLYSDREDLIGASLYITRAPCDGCQKLIDAAGIKRVVHPPTLCVIPDGPTGGTYTFGGETFAYNERSVIDSRFFYKRFGQTN